MIESMTGFGKGNAEENGISYSVELRSVNNRFLEITTRMPRILSHRENDIREIIKSKIVRGKITINVVRSNEETDELDLSVDTAKAKSIIVLLNKLRKSAKIKETIKMEHLLHFSEIFETKEIEEDDEADWNVFEQALRNALDAIKIMRQKEGAELAKDMRARVESINAALESIETISKERIPVERENLQKRIAELVSDKNIIDNQRLELEIALLSDRLDITEECVRFRSHNKFFLESLKAKESEGRKLNFLIQEMNREANTIGSKCSDVNIAHRVVGIKEELEKIREQLQNIE
ncbi:MAG: YicC family protein [Bacteroidetes bacterium]|nr:YicC family protein [Bacteroidota bacterium]